MSQWGLNRDYFLIFLGGWSVISYLSAGFLSALIFAPLLAMLSAHVLSSFLEFIHTFKKTK